MRNLTRSFRRELPNAKTLSQKVAAILRKYGTDAHVYLPGIGVINGLTAGNYLDSVGTTAATVDNPVGLVLDGAGSVGAELVTNGDFSNGTTGWSAFSAATTISNVSGVLRVTIASGAAGTASQASAMTTVVGKTYLCTWTKVATNGTGYKLYIGNSFGGGGPYTQTSTTNSGNFECRFVATSTTTYISLEIAGVVGNYADFDNISVKEVTGIHATQATTANKPILRRGAVNLLAYSEQFDNAAWSKSGVTVSQNAINAPNGTLTADKLIATTALNQHSVSSSDVNIGLCTRSIYMKAAEYIYGAITAYYPSTNYAGAIFNLSTGTVHTVSSGDTATITNVGNGWYRCTLTTNRTGSTAFGGMAVRPSIGVGFGESYSGDDVSGIYIWGAQLQTGSVATDYIPTTTAAASSSTGNYHWIADSTDLLTATYPAGYESVTVINALAGGQQTLTAQNILGSYSIGPSVDTYGRFIFRTGLTASELTTMQTFANRLAGV